MLIKKDANTTHQHSRKTCVTIKNCKDEQRENSMQNKNRIARQQVEEIR